MNEIVFDGCSFVFGTIRFLKGKRCTGEKNGIQPLSCARTTDIQGKYVSGHVGGRKHTYISTTSARVSARLPLMVMLFPCDPVFPMSLSNFWATDER